jgi:hypothetical protein
MFPLFVSFQSFIVKNDFMTVLIRDLVSRAQTLSPEESRNSLAARGYPGPAIRSTYD